MQHYCVCQVCYISVIKLRFRCRPARGKANLECRMMQKCTTSKTRSNQPSPQINLQRGSMTKGWGVATMRLTVTTLPLLRRYISQMMSHYARLRWTLLYWRSWEHLVASRQCSTPSFFRPISEKVIDGSHQPAYTSHYAKIGLLLFQTHSFSLGERWSF